MPYTRKRQKYNVKIMMYDEWHTTGKIEKKKLIEYHQPKKRRFAVCRWHIFFTIHKMLNTLNQLFNEIKNILLEFCWRSHEYNKSTLFSSLSSYTPYFQ